MGKNPKCFSLVEINYFDMTEIKLGSKKYFHFFSKIFFFGGGGGTQTSTFQRNTLMKLQILGKNVPFKKCQQPLSWGSFRQFNEHKS